LIKATGTVGKMSLCHCDERSEEAIPSSDRVGDCHREHSTASTPPRVLVAGVAVLRFARSDIVRIFQQYLSLI
jgi:hypothetical protein